MNRTYYFTDETPCFRQPVQPEEGQPVRLRFQTAKADAVSIRLIHGEERLAMKPAEIEGDLRFFEITVVPEESEYRFYYEICEETDPEQVLFFDKRGLTEEPTPGYEFVIRSGYIVPEWLQGAIMYQIFTDRFRNGENRSDVQDREYIYLKKPVERVANWDSLPRTLDVGRFYGGDLPGILEKLDYLQDLGVQVLYLNPIFVSPSNHKYDSQDYDNVDPHLTIIARDGGKLLPPGAEDNKAASRYRLRVSDPENLEASNRWFAEFVAEIHRRGMKIILDGVFNHCGSFHRWLDREGIYLNPSAPASEKGAWHSEKSRYRSYFKFTSRKEYESWWDVVTLPKLNYEESPELQEEILRIAEKWVSPPYNIDGWRLDVAADLGHSPEFNHEFWKTFRRRVKQVNPDAVILAEHYGDVSPWLEGDEWDTVMNYDAFMEPVTWFLTGMEKHSDRYDAELDGNADAFWDTMTRNMAKFSYGSCFGAMNQLDNHDHSRFLTRTSRRVGRLATAGAEAASQDVDYGILRQAVIMQMTWPGAPTLYYGDETGVCGWTDPDSRRSYPWGKEDWQLIEFYKYAIGIHNTHPACIHGSLVKLYSEDGVIGYGRFAREDRIVVFVNSTSFGRWVEADLGVMGAREADPYRRIMQTTGDGYNVGRIDVRLHGKTLTCMVPAGSAVVFRSIPEAEFNQICFGEQQ